MSLQRLIRNAAWGIALTLGCAPSENKFDRAFDTAKEELQRRGIEVRGGLWNKEDQYTQLFREMRYDLGDVQSALSRRHGATSCDEVGLSSYNSSTYYCGPGAVQGDCERVDPGDCFNEVCYDHDKKVYELFNGANQLCLWSEQTAEADIQFFQGYGRCAENDECGFYCQLIGAIALNLSAIEQGYSRVGPGCLWDGNYQQPRQADMPNDMPQDNTNLIDVCIQWHRRNYLDCTSNPDLYKQLIARDCTEDNIESIMRNRSRLECGYEKDCNNFQNCLDKNPI
ncbi:MAG: hypothetical protein Q7K45_00420 [Nanoarchaeota archaeon]|nr:hypothetical protein [Nanoarchaeota archaeon]